MVSRSTSRKSPAVAVATDEHAVAGFVLLGEPATVPADAFTDPVARAAYCVSAQQAQQNKPADVFTVAGLLRDAMAPQDAEAVLAGMVATARAGGSYADRVTAVTNAWRRRIILEYAAGARELGQQVTDRLANGDDPADVWALFHIGLAHFDGHLRRVAPTTLAPLFAGDIDMRSGVVSLHPSEVEDLAAVHALHAVQADRWVTGGTAVADAHRQRRAQLLGLLPQAAAGEGGR